jgi:hypothetical protein
MTTLITEIKIGKVIPHKSFYSINNFKSKILFRKSRTKVKDVLPFRIRFTNFTFEAYGPDNPAPIGIAVINRNNYIL